MRALQLTKSSSQSPELSLATVPTPNPTAGQVLVRVTASYINPSDILNSKGGFVYTTFPRVPGRDFAGIVEATGTPSSNFKPKDRVFGTSGKTLSFSVDGAHAELILVPEEGLVKTPEVLSDAQAAMVGVPYTTAALALKSTRVAPGETVLILGSTGAVGTAAVQYAKAMGARVFLGARNEKSEEGVDLVADPSLSKVMQLTNGKGVDIIVNTVGDIALQTSALAVLAPYGRLSYISAPRAGSTEFSFDLTSFYRKQLSILGNNSLLMSLEESAQSLKELVPLFEQGKLQVIGEEKLKKISVEEGVDAYADLSKGSRTKYMILN